MRHIHASKRPKHMTRLPKNFARALRLVSGRDFSHIALPGYVHVVKDKDGNVIKEEWCTISRVQMMEFTKKTVYNPVKEGEEA